MKVSSGDILFEGEYEQENYQEFNARYKGFGKDIYSKMNRELPFVLDNIKLYKKVDYQLPDSFSVFDNGKSTFAIQLDPECEVIIIWNKKTQIEFGNWTIDLYNSVFNGIRNTIYQPHII